MNKFQKFLNGLKLLVKKPSLINLIIDNEYRWHNYLKKKYPNKTQLPIVDIENLVKDTTTLNNFTFLGGGSLPTDILLLKSLAKQITNCSYFEIGTWRGESVINVAEEAKECYTLNLSKEELVSHGFTKEYANLHGVLSKDKKNIVHLSGNSLNYNFNALHKKFDLIFIDGNHQYQYIKNDTEKVFSNLTHKNSIIVWHDYAFNPEKIRSEVLAGILDGLPNGYEKDIYHVSNSLCAIYYPKEIQSYQIKFPLNPKKTFNVKIETKKI